MTTGRGHTRISVFLASISHPDLAGLSGQVEGVSFDGTLRIANYRQPFVSRGDTFIPIFFRPKRPELGARRGTLKLAIDNVDQRITSVVRTLTRRASLLFEEVYAHEPDTVIRTWGGMESVQFETTEAEVTATFGPPMTEGGFMGVRISPSGYPGAFD